MVFEIGSKNLNFDKKVNTLQQISSYELSYPPYSSFPLLVKMVEVLAQTCILEHAYNKHAYNLLSVENSEHPRLKKLSKKGP